MTDISTDDHPGLITFSSSSSLRSFSLPSSVASMSRWSYISDGVFLENPDSGLSSIYALDDSDNYSFGSVSDESFDWFWDDSAEADSGISSLFYLSE